MLAVDPVCFHSEGQSSKLKQLANVKGHCVDLFNVTSVVN